MNQDAKNARALASRAPLWRQQIAAGRDKQAIFNAGGRLCVAVGAHDDEQEKRMQELSRLLKCTQSFVSNLEMQPLMSAILSQLKTLVDYSGAAILRLQGDQISVLDYQGPLARVRLEQALPLLEPGLAWMRRRREVFLGNDLRGEARWTSAYTTVAGVHEQGSGTLQRQFRSWMAVPLLARESVQGALVLHHRRSHFYAPHHASVASSLAHSAAIALENAHLHEQAQAQAAMQERQHISRELHDSVSQAFYGICLNAHSALEALQADPLEAQASLQHVLMHTELGLAELRALLFELRPESLVIEGLVAALQQQVLLLQTCYRLPVDAWLNDEPALPPESKHALYRVAQEALHNVVKHARASRVTLRLLYDARELVLEIRDDGRGFDTAGSFPGHLGLQSMQERMLRINGALVLESTPGSGTSVIARTPILQRHL
jgi:signal transduction histidine kinase